MPSRALENAIPARHCALCMLSRACHIAVVGRDQVASWIISMAWMRQRVGEIAVGGGNIRLDRMGHSIHTGVRNQLLRHGLGKVRVNDGDIRGDLEVSDRVLDALADNR